jgi:hypothetical protein
MKWLWVLMAAFALTASAADVSGTWKGSAETQNGTIERTFVFKADGNKLTGETTSNMFGKSTIEGGKVDGDNLSFHLTVNMGGQEARVDYKGNVVDANTIKFQVEVQDLGQTLELIVKRVP